MILRAYNGHNSRPELDQRVGEGKGHSVSNYRSVNGIRSIYVFSDTLVRGSQKTVNHQGRTRMVVSHCSLLTTQPMLKDPNKSSSDWYLSDAGGRLTATQLVIRVRTPSTSSLAQC